jgi:hypothetical protein
MPIPALTTEGFLPEGVHDCTLDEIDMRFGQFQRTEKRPRLFERLKEYVRQAQIAGLVTAIIVDGSFISATDAPNDIDLIVVFPADNDFAAELRPFEYNVVSRPQVRRIFRLDALFAAEGQPELAEQVAFFGRVRERADVRKGMLRVTL